MLVHILVAIITSCGSAQIALGRCRIFGLKVLSHFCVTVTTLWLLVATDEFVLCITVIKCLEPVFGRKNKSISSLMIAMAGMAFCLATMESDILVDSLFDIGMAVHAFIICDVAAQSIHMTADTTLN